MGCQIFISPLLPLRGSTRKCPKQETFSLEKLFLKSVLIVNDFLKTDVIIQALLLLCVTTE